MKLLTLCFLIVFGTLVSCSKDENSNCMTLDCSDRILEELEMVRYVNQESYCYSLHLWIYQNKQYFILDCCLCDQAPNPFDCNNNYFCETNDEYDAGKCDLFFSKAKHAGIIGVLE